MKQILNGCVFPVRSNDFLITTNSQETKKNESSNHYSSFSNPEISISFNQIMNQFDVAN